MFIGRNKSFIKIIPIQDVQKREEEQIHMFPCILKFFCIFIHLTDTSECLSSEQDALKGIGEGIGKILVNKA